MATPPFIIELRKKIGHDPLWLIGVTAYVEDDAGRILLGRRADTGEWAPVYGIVDPGEEPADAAAREVMEETGIAVTVEHLVRVRAQQEMTVYDNGDQVQYLDVMFLCRPAADEKGTDAPYVADDESLDVGWFAPDALPNPLAASARERFEALARWREQAAEGDRSALFGRRD